MGVLLNSPWKRTHTRGYIHGRLILMRGFPKIRGAFLGGPHKKEYSIEESMLRELLVRETTT